ncbi:MAG TPA: (2Fe-2S) ferredoxin domain-containing protein [Candidatus Thermoplasmatota archaeon]|nr:(2Fe-2S) ferredoxin domain-containing protein [Candidatus Thermoplasmatota archaeon]
MPDAPYRGQVLVCTYGAWCRIEGSEEVRAALKQGVKDAGLASEVRVTKSGCLGQCGHGPNVAVWPENVWYHRVKLQDVPDLLAHLKGGPVVERLRYRPAKAGSNKTPEVLAKEAKTGAKVE